jgi:hypothetical protein
MCIANPFDLFPFVVRVYLLLLYWLLHQHLDKIMEKEKADMSVQQQHRHSCLCNMWVRLYNITCVFPFFLFHWKNWNAPACHFDQIFVLLEFLAAERFGIRPYFIDAKIQLTSAAVPLAIKPRVDFRTAIQIYKTRCVNTNTSSLVRVYTTAWATARPSSSRPTQRASEMAA